MGRRIKPYTFRLGLSIPWSNRWFFKKSLKYFIEEDYVVREIIKEKMPAMGIAGVSIERTRNEINVFIKSNRPGLIIGRRGKGIEELKSELVKKLNSLRREKSIDLDFSVRLNVVEMGRSELSAVVSAAQIASDIERRIPFRTVLKQHLRAIKQNREIKGAKIRISGRLNGAEIARTENLSFGSMPLNYLRANIDYGEATAFTTYGAIGIKVWLYKGEVFDDK